VYFLQLVCPYSKFGTVQVFEFVLLLLVVDTLCSLLFALSLIEIDGLPSVL